MTQTRLGSFYETCIGTAIGFVLSFTLGHYLFPYLGWYVSVTQNLQITAIFTVLSIARGYLIRRFFNARIHALAQRLAGN